MIGDLPDKHPTKIIMQWKDEIQKEALGNSVDVRIWRVVLN